MDPFIACIRSLLRPHVHMSTSTMHACMRRNSFQLAPAPGAAVLSDYLYIFCSLFLASIFVRYINYLVMYVSQFKMTNASVSFRSYCVFALLLLALLSTRVAAGPSSHAEEKAHVAQVLHDAGKPHAHPNSPLPHPPLKDDNKEAVHPALKAVAEKLKAKAAAAAEPEKEAHLGVVASPHATHAVAAVASPSGPEQHGKDAPKKVESEKTVHEVSKEKNIEALCTWNDCTGGANPCQVARKGLPAGAPLKCFPYRVLDGDLTCPPNTADCRDRFMSKEELIANHVGQQVPWALFGIIFAAVAYLAETSRRATRLRSSQPKSGYTGEFRNSLFGCFCKPEVACLSCFGGSILATYNRIELEERRYSVWDFFINYMCFIPVVFANRQTLRHRMNMVPSPCSDFFSVVFCTYCAVGQHTMELEQGVSNIQDSLKDRLEDKGIV